MIAHGKTDGRIGWLICKGVVFALFFLYAISLLYPIFFTFLTSLRSQAAYDAGHVSFMGIEGFKSYLEAFEKMELGANTTSVWELILNSLWYTVGGCGASIIASAMTAYVVAKYRFRMRNFFYAMAIFTMSLPIVGQLPSQFVIYQKLGIYNNPLLIFSFFGGFGFNFVVLY